MIKFGKKKAVNSDTDKDKNKKTAVKHDEHKIEIINVNKTYDMGRESLHVLKNINFKKISNLSLKVSFTLP